MSLDEQGFIDLSRLEKKDYGKLLLARNPFPSTALPSEIPLTTADRRAILRRFFDVLSALNSDNSSSVTVLLGDYGTGKSHLLKLFKASVNKTLPTSDKPILAVYAKSPGRTIRELLLYIIDDLTKEFLTALSANWLFKQLSQSGHSTYLPYGKNIELKSVSDIPNFLQNCKIIELINDQRKQLSEIRNADLVRAFLFLPHPDFGSVAWRWFIGSSLSRNEKDTLGIDELIQDASIAEQVLNAFFKLLHLVGIEGVVLLVDELEALTLIAGIPKGLYQDALRHLIDANPTGCVLFFAITPGAWNKLTESPSALERRLASAVFDLQPFDQGNVTELIQKYIRASRKDEESIKIKKLALERKEINPAVYPFTNDAIEVIFSSTRGIANKVILLCRLCVDNATDAGCLIDAPFVQRVIQQEGFS